MHAKLPERSLEDALETWSKDDLRDVVIDAIRDMPKSQLIDFIVEYDMLDGEEVPIIREAFPETRQQLVRPVTKGVCQCGHLQSDHQHFAALFDGRVRIANCTVRNRDFRRCGCFNYGEDPAGEWTGNEESRVGWL